MDILDALISETVLFFNLGHNMSDIQIRLTTELILADELAKNLKPEDFKVLFNNAKKGHYGKAYNRMDGQIIFEWINAYLAERMDLIEQNSIKQHAEHKKDPVDVNVEGQKKVLEILKGAIENATEVKKEKPIREKSPRDIFIQKCLVEFDSLHERNSVYSKSGRFIEYEGKNVDVNEFLTIKVKQYDNENR